jgi:hypothetical protein
MTEFTAEQYRDPDSGRSRWAVLCRTSRVFYFPRRYGLRAAQALARRLNREASDAGN